MTFRTKFLIHSSIHLGLYYFFKYSFYFTIGMMTARLLREYLGPWGISIWVILGLVYWILPDPTIKYKDYIDGCQIKHFNEGFFPALYHSIQERSKEIQKQKEKEKENV